MNESDSRLEPFLRRISAVLSRPIRVESSTEVGVASNGGVECEVGGVKLVLHAGDQPLTFTERSLLKELVTGFEREIEAASTIAELQAELGLLEQKSAQLTLDTQAIADSSSRDRLTGLFSRSYMLDKLEEEMNRAWRKGAMMSLMMIDLDHLRTINGRYGLAVGDQVLQQVGSVIKTSCRVYDVPSRFAGEQFCILLPDTPLGKTRPVAERIRRRIQSVPIRADSESVSITSSIGVSGLDSLPEEALFSTSSLLERALQALDAAKSRGRNRVVVWTPSLPGVRSVTIEH